MYREVKYKYEGVKDSGNVYSVSRLIDGKWRVLEEGLSYKEVFGKYGKAVGRTLATKYAKRYEDRELHNLQVLNVLIGNHVHTWWRIETPGVPYHVSTRLLARNAKYWFRVIMNAGKRRNTRQANIREKLISKGL